MRILITGANGYIGARLTKYLSGNGHQIIALCYPQIPDVKKWDISQVDLIVGDLRNSEIVSKIAYLKLDAIIHLVSLDHNTSEGEPGFVSSINLMPTWSLLHVCEKEGLKKFIYFSTIHVYGKNNIGEVDEDRYPQPMNVYGLTHFLSEEISNYFNRKGKVRSINVRLSNSYGEPVFEDAACWDLIINDLCKTAYMKKEIRLKSDGSAVRDFIHFSDICRNIEKILSLNNNLIIKNTLNFSSGNMFSMIEIAKKVREVYKKKYDIILPIYINHDELWNSEKNKEKIDNFISNKYSNEIGIRFNKRIEEGISDLFIYLEGNDV